MKFKNGDRVKIIGGKGYDRWDSSGKHLGKVAAVTDALTSDSVFLNDNEWSINFKEEWLEAAPIKLKVGQKVKIIADAYSPRRLSHEIPLGTIVIIFYISDYSSDRQPYCVEKPNGGTRWVTREDIEPIEETPKSSSKPKKGDKFKVIRAYHGFTVGDIVTFTHHSGVYNHFENAKGKDQPMHYQQEASHLFPDEVEPIEIEEQGKFKVGDKVKVLDLGKHYSTYEEWAKAVGAKYYKDHQHFENGEIGKIVAIGSHELGGASHSSERILALVRIDKRDLIIGIEGIELYEEKKWGDFPFLTDKYMNIATPHLYPHWFDTTQEKPKQKEVKNKAMAKGKEGDRFRVINDDEDVAKGRFVYLSRDDGSTCPFFKDESGTRHCMYWENLEAYPGIVHTKGFMKKLSIMATKLVDADVKAFVEAGILDSELNITEEGRDFVLTQVLNDNKAKYATEAKKLVADARKEKKGE